MKLIITILGFFSGILTATLIGHLQAAEKPNFLFIIADDCTHRDLGCYGGQAKTPHIDQLASEGMRLTQCFQAAPMCSPTRHNIYTGLYPVKSGAYPNHTFAKEGTKSVVHYLKPLGYRVALSGKKHIAPQEVFPFEILGKANNPDMKLIDEFFEDCVTNDQPFCLFACSNEPHTPWNKGDASVYPPDKIKLPPYFVDTPKTRESMSKYLAEISYFDGQVGQCLELLEKHQLVENTMVMVVSEQGSSFPFAKWTCYDSGLQSACVVRWPGKIKQKSVSDAIVEYVDILPTFLEAAGGKLPEILDGKSFLPVLQGDTDTHKEFVYGIMTTRGIINASDQFGIRSIRSGKYKYIMNLTPEIGFKNACTISPEFKEWEQFADMGNLAASDKVARYRNRPAEELYDISKDWYEWDNLAQDPKMANVKAELKEKLLAWMESQGDQGIQTELDAPLHQNRNRNKGNKNSNKKKNRK